MKNKLRTWVALALCLTACGTPGETVPEAPSSPPPTVAENAPAEENEGGPDTDPASEAIFPRSFRFASGAGGWSTDLEVAADGSFTGVYYDSDNGMVTFCNFHGEFSQPVQVDEYTYSMRLENIEQEDTEGDETLVDGIRYVASSPYGLDGADEILIYLPGSQRQDLPEGFVGWAETWHPWDTEDRMTSQEGTDKLTRYGLYNVSGEQGFVSVDE